MKCLKCGGIIKSMKCYDSEVNHDYTEFWRGACSKCGAVHEWEEVFAFIGAENFRITDQAECKG